MAVDVLPHVLLVILTTTTWVSVYSPRPVAEYLMYEPAASRAVSRAVSRAASRAVSRAASRAASHAISSQV